MRTRFFSREQNSVSSNTQPVPIPLIFELYDVSLMVILKQIDSIADHLPNFFRERMQLRNRSLAYLNVKAHRAEFLQIRENSASQRFEHPSVSARQSSY
jgi:hypothetical protein